MGYVLQYNQNIYEHFDHISNYHKVQNYVKDTYEGRSKVLLWKSFHAQEQDVLNRLCACMYVVYLIVRQEGNDTWESRSYLFSIDLHRVTVDGTSMFRHILTKW